MLPLVVQSAASTLNGAGDASMECSILGGFSTLSIPSFSSMGSGESSSPVCRVFRGQVTPFIPLIQLTSILQLG